MIRFRDTKARNGTPSWLVGASELHQRSDQHGTLWACGEAYLLNGDGPWLPLDDGYEVAGTVEDHDAYRRATPCLDVEMVTDLHGREWAAPKILDAAGERVFRVNYGRDFLPSLTPEQYRYVDIAKAARDALVAAKDGTQDAPMAIACRWAAELLCATYHLTPETIAALAILDDALVSGVIGAAIGAGVEAVR